MATWFLPAASLRSTHRLPAARALLLAANYLICRVLWSIGRTIFGVGSKFLPALREGELRGGVEQGPFPPQLVHEAGTTRSAHRRHDVFGTGADAGGPACGHRLEAGVEAHAFGAVHRHVAEQGALPAAKAVEGHRHRDRHIDADHADLDAVRKFACGVAVAGEDGRPVAVFMVVNELSGSLEIGGAHDRQHRPKDFFFVLTNLGLHLAEHAAADEKAVLIALQFEPAAVDHE